MPDYQQGKIYKIECLNTGKIYIGSTCQKMLSQRLAEHVRHYKMYLNEKFVYITSYEVLEGENYEITLIKLCPCNSHDELLMEERKVIQEHDCVNSYMRKSFTDEEKKENRKKACKIYRELYHDEIKVRNKIYRENNIEKLREKNRKYTENNIEKIKEKSHLHYIETKGKNQKMYYENHKSEIMERKRIKRRLKNLYLEQLKYYNI